MSDMRRLRDETRSPFARALLESAEGERPDSGACDRALGALGLGAVGAGVVATSTAAKAASAVVASAGVGAGASQVTSVAAKGGTLYLVKWIGIGILGSAAVIGAASYVPREVSAGAPRTIASTQTSLRPSPPAQIKGGPSVPIAPAAAASPSLGASRDPKRRSSPPNDSRAALAPAKPKAEAASNAPPSPPALPLQAESLGGPAVESIATNAESVTAQLAALSGVRAALAAHDPDRALALLGAIEARNPSSPFAEEISVLRIDALADADRRAESAALARAFVARYPSSAYGEHVRSKTKIP